MGKTSGSKREKVTGGWGKLPMEELRGLQSSPANVKVIRLKGMKWLGHAARKEKYKMDSGFWWGKLEERNHVEDLGAEKKIILKST